MSPWPEGGQPSAGVQGQCRIQQNLEEVRGKGLPKPGPGVFAARRPVAVSAQQPRSVRRLVFLELTAVKLRVMVPRKGRDCSWYHHTILQDHSDILRVGGLRWASSLEVDSKKDQQPGVVETWGQELGALRAGLRGRRLLVDLQLGQQKIQGGQYNGHWTESSGFEEKKSFISSV